MEPLARVCAVAGPWTVVHVCPSPAHTRVFSPSFLQNLLRHRVESPVARGAGLAGVGSPPFSTYSQPTGPSEHLATGSPGCSEPPFPRGLSGPRSTRFSPPGGSTPCTRVLPEHACTLHARVCAHVSSHWPGSSTCLGQSHTLPTTSGIVVTRSTRVGEQLGTFHSCTLLRCTPSPCFPAPSVRVPPFSLHCAHLQCIQVCMSNRVSTHSHVCIYFFNTHIHCIYSGPTKVLYNQEFI